MNYLIQVLVLRWGEGQGLTPFYAYNLFDSAPNFRIEWH